MRTHLETLLITALQDILTVLNKKNNGMIGESASTLNIRAIIAASLKETGRTGP